MTKNEIYGPFELPKVVGGEYDTNAIERYIIESFEEVLRNGFADELGKRRLAKKIPLSKGYFIEHTAGRFGYTVKRNIYHSFTQYSIEPSSEGPLKIEYGNDLLEKLLSAGEGYLRIVVGVKDDDFALVVQKIGDNGIENVAIDDPEEMAHFGNIINLLEPA